MSDDTHTLYAEMPQQAVEVLGEGTAALTVWIGGSPEGPVIKGDAREVLGEEGDLLPPGKVVAAGAVGKYQGRPGAVDLVVQISAVYFCEGHGCYAFALNPRRRRALVSTETELVAMAAAASTGFKKP